MKPRFRGRDLGFANLVAKGGVGLLVVTHDQFSRDGREVAKESACALVGSGAEIDFAAR